VAQVSFPLWRYYPANRKPDSWVEKFVAIVAAAQVSIDTATVHSGLSSDAVLKILQPGLTGIGYSVELGKSTSQKLRRPVLFGDQGRELESYEVDGWNDEDGVILEIEAGRGAMSNAIYRDLIRTSLIADARFLALGLMVTYRYGAAEAQSSARSYESGQRILDAIYASGRLRLPFEGVLLFGY
jgi:hypothetical protein